MQRIIGDGRARRIAAEWHDGQRSALYAFVSTGTIATTDITDEIHRSRQFDTAAATRGELDELLAYVTAHGDRGPVTGWCALWDEPRRGDGQSRGPRVA